MAEPAFHVAVGDAAAFAKTVAESDVYLFAGITGDLSPNHVDEEAMRRTAYGRRIAHGALLVGYMSNASTRLAERAQASAAACGETAVSAGYDRIRFVAPVFIGDTVRIDYRIAAIDPERRRSRAAVEMRNQDGTLVAVAEHILQWVPDRPC